MALEILVRIGMSDPGQPRDELLARVNTWEFINRLHWAEWDRILDPLPATDQEAATKGLVIAEETHRWSGGSVAAAIWVFRSFARKFPTKADALAEWILAASTNPWVPFGSDRGAARTLQEYRDHLQWNASRRRQTEVSEKSLQDLSARKEIVRRRLVPYRENLQKAVSQARSDLIAVLSTLPARERFEHLAWDDQHPLSYFPVELADCASAAWSELDEETRQKLITRAAAVPRGPWKQWLNQRKTDQT